MHVHNVENTREKVIREMSPHLWQKSFRRFEWADLGWNYAWDEVVYKDDISSTRQQDKPVAMFVRKYYLDIILNVVCERNSQDDGHDAD